MGVFGTQSSIYDWLGPKNTSADAPSADLYDQRVSMSQNMQFKIKEDI